MRRATRAAPRSAGTAKPCQAIYGRCATSGQVERPTPPTPGGGGGHPGAVCRGEPQPQPSSSRRGLCLNPARAPAGGAEAAGEACRSRALLAGPGAAQPQRSGSHAGGACDARGLSHRGSAGWAGPERREGRTRWEHVGDNAHLMPHRGGAPPLLSYSAAHKGRASAYLGPARGGVGCRGGEPPCRGIRCAQSPRAWRVRPRPSRGVGLLPILERRESHGRHPGSIVHPH